MLEITLGALRNEDKFPIGRRMDDNKNHPGLWELPGGKIDPTDESSWHGLKREWMEEMEIDIHPHYLIPPREMEGMMVHPWICNFVSGKPRLNAHSEVKFITFYEINNYKFTPISKSVIHIIKGSYLSFFQPSKETNT
jgi:8-oxo-dGTP pyrophosphatase MutT (NUDIX family)